MILRQAKNPQSGRACAPGGSARQEAGDPPPLGRTVGFLNADRTRGPLWAEWPIPRADARAAGGGAGEGGTLLQNYHRAHKRHRRSRPLHVGSVLVDSLRRSEMTARVENRLPEGKAP